MLRLPDGTYELNVGKSFSKSSKNRQEYHTLRYDFKPKSVNNDQETYIATTGNDDIHIGFVNDTDNLTMYKGASKPLKDGKECLLIFDEDKGELRLEKVMTNMNVKQTRGASDEIDQAIRTQIEDHHRHRKPPSKRVQISPPVKKETPLPTPKLTPQSNKSKEESYHDAMMSTSSSSDEEDGEIVDTQEKTPPSVKALTHDEESNQSAEPARRYSFNLSSGPASPSVSSSSDDEFAAELERRINAKSSSPEPTATTTTNEDDDMPDLFGFAPTTNQAPTPEKQSSSNPATSRCQLTMDLALSDTSDED
ncbi:Ell-associated factor Eaf [Aphelenchoides bicaudatus]|nr:Ell-associated factor Eaf [Aphelenchoides bicaudatus]